MNTIQGLHLLSVHRILGGVAALKFLDVDKRDQSPDNQEEAGRGDRDYDYNHGSISIGVGLKSRHAS